MEQTNQPQNTEDEQQPEYIKPDVPGVIVRAGSQTLRQFNPPILVPAVGAKQDG